MNPFCKTFFPAFLFAFITLMGHAQAPSITSFSPVSGPVGTTVTITGTNFSTTASNNIVFFGAVKATVSAASAASLTVKVPAGATYKPITVTVNQLTGYTLKPFAVTFNTIGSNRVINGVFAPKSDFSNGGTHNDNAVGDIDGDGKPDIIVINDATRSFSVLKNTTLDNTFSFLNTQEYVAGTTPFGIGLGDLNGDGKLDVAIANYSSGDISVFRNTTVNGNISFASKVDIVVGGNPSFISINDFNKDGKPDIAITNYGINVVSVLKNTTNLGFISFDSPINYQTGTAPIALSINDIDGDGMVDISVANFQGNSFSVIRNISTNNILSFESAQNFNTGAGTYDISGGDLDNDDKVDICTANFFDASISIFRNISIPGIISFAAKNDLLLNYDIPGEKPYKAVINDINGDGKPDIVVGALHKASIFENNSSNGGISFRTRVDVFASSGALATSLSVADITLDGKPDIVCSNGYSSNISLLKNKTGITSIISFQPVQAGLGSTVKIVGANFNAVSSVKFGGVAASSFNLLAPDTISATVGNGFTGYVSVTTALGIDSLSGFTWIPQPVITSFAPLSTGEGGKVTLKGKNFGTASQVSFGGTDAASFIIISDTVIEAIVGKGASGSISVLTAGGKAILSGFLFISAPSIYSFSPLIGRPGYIITVKGENLTNTSSVYFGGKAASSFLVLNDSTLVATVAFGSTGNVSLVTPGGDIAMEGFTYLGRITGFSPASAANGTTVTITGTDFNGTSGVSFGNNPASSFNLVSSTVIKANVGAGSSGNIIVDNPNGTDTIAGFLYIPPKPKITSFDPLYGSIDWPGINIYGSNFIEINSVTFGGIPTSFVVIDQGHIVAGLSTGASGYVKVSNIGGADSIGGFTYYYQPVITSFSPSHATTNDTIIIKGNHFISTSSVQLGNFQAASYAVISDTVIKAVVGAGAWDTSIYISTYGGSAVLGGYSFYTHPPVFNSFTPNIGDSGTMITIRGKFLTEVTGVKFGGTTASAFTVVNDTTITAVVNNGASGSVTVTNITSTATLPGFTFIPTVQPPVINSFSPLSGIAGTTVVISGSNFSSTAADNVVYFGAVKANILSASPTILTVTVPPGASYAPITVTVIPNKLTAFSVKIFSPIFPNTDSSAAYKFKQQPDLVTSVSPYRSAIADFDGDGKPDVAVTYNNSVVVSVFRNTSTVLSVTFEPKKDFITIRASFGITASDVNGDGKPDIIITHPIDPLNSNSPAIGIFKNTSSSGNISFAEETPLLNNAGTEYRNTILRDWDGDGKADIAATDYIRYRNLEGGSPVSVFTNNGSAGNLSFAANAKDFFTPYYVLDFICTGDIDGDGKPDIVASSQYSKYIMILRNNSEGKNISFTEEGSYPIAYTPGGLALGDIDGDGKPDIVTTLQGNQVFSVSGNISTPGHIAFAYRADFSTGHESQQNIVLSDMDGDGKPDIALTKNFYNTVHSISLFKNKSAPGVFSFEYKNEYNTGVGPVQINAGDLNSDGRPDLLTVNSIENTISVFRNTIGAPPFISSISPTSASEGATITIKGENFYNSTGVSFGGISATAFTIESDSVIKAVVGSGATGNVSVFTPAGDAVFSGFNFLSPKYVTQNGAGLKNGNSWTNAWGATEFANNLYNQSAGTSIWIAKGVYKPLKDENGIVNANSSLLTFSVPAGVRLYGGFAGNEVSLNKRVEQSIHGINTAKLSADIGTQNLQDDNCTVAVTLNNCGQDEALDGITISNAKGNGIKISFNANVISAPVINNCVVTDNSPSNAGLLITGNGSLSIKPVIRNTIFTNNHSSSFGAVLITGNCRPVFENCIFYNNGKTSAAGTGAAGITFSEAAGIISNCTFYENSTNHAVSNGAAVVLNNATDSVYINNTIFWNNYNAGGISNLLVASGNNSASVKNCLFQNQTNGVIPSVLINTLTEDPDFINPADADGIDDTWGTNDDGLLPKPYSNTIDYGINSMISISNITDLAANPRIINATIDIGAYEVQSGLLKLCPGGNSQIKSDLQGSSYQWQVNTGTAFSNIGDNSFYTGTNSGTLQITSAPSSLNAYKYRCLVNGSYSRDYILQFSNTWTGTVNNAWENAANWSCLSVPDVSTDVIISKGTIAVNSNISVKSLSIQPGVSFTVNPGYVVTLTGGGAATGNLGGSPGSCTPVTLAGLYKQGLALSPSNTLQVQVNVTVAGPYFISTNTVNGVSFSKAGTFTNIGLQNVTVNGTGTPEFYGNYNFTVQFGSSSCNFAISFTAATPDYFPIVTNSKWSYKAFNVITETSDSVYKQCLPDYVTYNGKHYRAFTEVSELLIDHTTGYRKNGNDYYLYYDHSANTYSLLFLEATGEIKLLNDNLPVGGTWTSNITGWVNSGSTTTPIQVQGTILEKGSSVTLSTGLTFSNVIKTRLLFFEMTVPSSPNLVYYEERWYALGVGLIYFKSGDPFGEGIRYELKRYQVY